MERTFSFTDDYAASSSTDPVEGDVFLDETIKLSRHIRALKLWLSLLPLDERNPGTRNQDNATMARGMSPGRSGMAVSRGFVPSPGLHERDMLGGVTNEAGAPALSVMLIVSDATAAIKWYMEALGADRLWDLGGVAALELAGAPFLLHDAVPGKRRESSPTDLGSSTARIEVFLDAPEELVARAARAGATDVEPVTDHVAPWGVHRQGGFTDPFGHRWSVGDRTPLRRHTR